MPAYSTELLDLQAALAGEYSIERELGRGGMGVVYLARDVQLDRNIAIKVLPGHLAERPDDRERFLREARTAAGLSHPHIVPIHRVGEAGGFVFFVMSYVPGQTLGERLRTGGPLPAAEVMRIMREVAWALAHAHGRGIVHRDVKPDNILLEEGTGRALVTDFGIAHGRGDAGPVTDPGRIMGTAHFMSPEQGRSGAVDGRSDLYSLGVVGYLAASGRLPFEAPSVPALLLRQSTQRPPSLGTVAPGLPPALVHAVDRCLATEAASRHEGGEALAGALAPTTEGRPALPVMLRSWVVARNPMQTFYAAATGLVGFGATMDLLLRLKMGQFDRMDNSLLMFAVALAPLVPMLGYHVRQAGRLFRAGFSLADLRTALDIDRRERMEDEAVVPREVPGAGHVVLRAGFYGSAAIWFASAFFSRDLGVPAGFKATMIIQATSFISTFVFLSVSNVNDVSLLPESVRRRTMVGLRERLWRSRFGEWLAQRLGAPAISTPVGGGVFRATEVALGVAAGQLYAALPAEWRAQLAELPAVVSALEARAAAARADVELLAAMGSADAGGDDLLAARRSAAAAHLSHTVAALEGIRLDLLRLHAGAGDLAPLTTLLDAARLLGEDVGRLAAARQAADGLSSPPRPSAWRTPTPA